ncbi:MAG: DUF362 domain-containing protein [Bacteroidales bacterium]|jgi:uncharacterized protein (DUF362 family)
MKRREFLWKSAGAGFVAGSALSFTGFSSLFGSELNSNQSPYDLVAVRGGEPDVMFDRAIAAMGGMQNFVKPNQSVLVKPNIGWDVIPERGANTNPGLVKRVIEHCFQAGASEVFVFDHTCDNWRRSYENSGIEAVVNAAGARILPGNDISLYRNVTVPGGRQLKEAMVHEQVLNADVFINIPVLKHHGGAQVTISMKNLMGIIWDRQWWHRNDLQQCIADFGTYRKPDLNIVDAYRVMMQNGPRGVSEDDIVLMKSLIISRDMVAADSAAARLFGTTPEQIGHIRLGHEMGIGNMELEKQSIHRIVV